MIQRGIHGGKIPIILLVSLSDSLWLCQMRQGYNFFNFELAGVSNDSASVRAKDECTPQPLSVSATSHTLTSTHDQSSQTADLTITSLLTISPPRHSPRNHTDSPAQENQSQQMISPPTHSSTARNDPRMQANHFRYKSSGTGIHSNGTNTARPLYSSDPSRYPLSSQNSASSLSSRPSSGHSQRAMETLANPLTSHTPNLQSTSTSSVSYGRPSPLDPALLTQQVSLLELDKLWRKFLTTSLLAKGKENTPTGSKSVCTCGAFSKPSATSNPTSVERDVIHTSAADQFSTPRSSDTNRSPASPVSLRLVDRSAQTSQNDLHHIPKPPEAFTIPPTKPRGDKPLDTVEPPASTPMPHTPPTHHTPYPPPSHTSYPPLSHTTHPPPSHTTYPPPSHTTHSPPMQHKSYHPPISHTAHTLSTPHPPPYHTTHPPSSSPMQHISHLPPTPHTAHISSTPHPPPTSHPAPIAFTINSVTGSSPVLDTYPANSSPVHLPVTTASGSVSTQTDFEGPLSLSEAFALRRPDFILCSQRRERRVREDSEVRAEKARLISQSRAKANNRANVGGWERSKHG